MTKIFDMLSDAWKKLKDAVANTVSSALKTLKQPAGAILIYIVCIVALFLYAGICIVKLWLAPIFVVLSAAYSAYAAYTTRYKDETFGEAFNRHLADTVERYLELGMD